MLVEDRHYVAGLVPVADCFAGTKATDVVSMAEWGHAEFLILKGAETTGTTVITVEACDDFTPSTQVAIPFKYRTCSSGDTWSAVTDAEATGFTTAAAANVMYRVEVDSDAIAKAAPTYPNLRLKAVESANDPVTAAVLIVLSQPRYGNAVNATAIA